MNKFFTKKRIISGAVVLAVVLAFLLSDLRFLLLPRSDLVTNILHGTPVTAIPLEQTDVEFPLYSGMDDYYRGVALYEHNGVSLTYLQMLPGFHGDVETGKIISGDLTFLADINFFLKDNKLCFIAPVKPEDLARLLDYYYGKEFDPPPHPDFWAHPVFQFGENSVTCDWITFSVSCDEIATTITLSCEVYDTLEEGRELFMDDGIYSTTLHLDDLYYYEFSLNPLQQVILGGVLQ